MLVLSVCYAGHAQFSDSYAVPDDPGFDKVQFSLRATNGHCIIEAGSESPLLEVSNRTNGNIHPQFTENIQNRVKHVQVIWTDTENGYLTSSFSKRMFTSSEQSEEPWKVRLSKLKPLDLNLNYTVGDTYIDLSDLPVERLNMRTGSSNVKIFYSDDMPNRLAMDTFLIKVDMGTLNAQNLHLCRSKNILADVGFGKVRMDFGNADDIHTDVVATVGAGSLEVILPQNNIPVRININDSPLCHITIPKDFEGIEKNVFIANQNASQSQNYITFSVDVAVGNIEFKTANQ